MTPRIYRTGPDHFAGSRPSTDADRLQKHGPIQSMDAPGFFENARIIARIGLGPALGLFAGLGVAILSIVAFAGGA